MYPPQLQIFTCPICGKVEQTKLYNKKYCGPSCRKRAERDRIKEVMREERLNMKADKQVEKRGIVRDATGALLDVVELQLTAGGVSDFREFLNPDVSWEPTDSRVTWSMHPETKVWVMIFNGNVPLATGVTLPIHARHTAAKATCDTFFPRPLTTTTTEATSTPTGLPTKDDDDDDVVIELDENKTYKPPTTSRE